MLSLIVVWAFGSATLLLAVFAGLAIETLHRRPDAARAKAVRLNLGWLLLRQAVDALLAPLVVPVVVLALQAAGAGLIRIEGPWSGAAVALLAIDFQVYWLHRLGYHGPLWPLHSLHHSERHFGAATAFRVHLSHVTINRFLVFGPVAVVFEIEPGAALLSGYLLAASAVFLHLDVPWGLGRLTPFLGGPQWHRLHHSLLPEHRGRNFGAVTPLWDHLFGTYMAPPAEPPPTGCDDAPPISVWQATVWPLLRPRRAALHIRPLAQLVALDDFHDRP